MVLCLGSIVNKDLFTRIHFHGLEKMGNIFIIKILNFCTLCAIMMVIFVLYMFLQSFEKMEILQKYIYNTKVSSLTAYVLGV